MELFVVKIIKSTLGNKCKVLNKRLLMFTVYHKVCLKTLNIRNKVSYTLHKIEINQKLESYIEQLLFPPTSCQQVRFLPLKQLSNVPSLAYPTSASHVLHDNLLYPPLTWPLIYTPHTIHELSKIQTLHVITPVEKSFSCSLLKHTKILLLCLIQKAFYGCLCIHL